MATAVLRPSATASLAPSISSAAGVLSLLNEDDEELQIHALKQLHRIVDLYWSEISDAVDVLEELSEDEVSRDHWDRRLERT